MSDYPLVLVSGATATMRRLNDVRFGELIVPGAKNAPNSLRLRRAAWAMDNGAYAGFDEAAFERMLDRYYRKPGCLFVSAPDVVGDAKRTETLFRSWRARLARYGYPVALVAQDGLTFKTTPWDEIDALFVGGTTSFKWSDEAATLMAYAKAFGKHVHVGRVNSFAALKKAQRRGADSVDGTHISRWPDIGSARYQRWMGRMSAQPELWS